jgi:hypothetical protein
MVGGLAGDRQRLGDLRPARTLLEHGGDMPALEVLEALAQGRQRAQSVGRSVVALGAAAQLAHRRKFVGHVISATRQSHLTHPSVMFDLSRSPGSHHDMRKVIRKRIRHSDGGLNVAADIDAVIAVNTGADAATSHTVVRSSHTVVQGAGAGRPDRDATPPDARDHPKEKP